MPAEVSILAVLMLRGPQTVNELKTRTARLATIDDLQAELERLAEKELVEDLGRQPGQREERWAHLLGEGARGAESARRSSQSLPNDRDSLEDRVARARGAAGRARAARRSEP